MTVITDTPAFTLNGTSPTTDPGSTTAQAVPVPEADPQHLQRAQRIIDEVSRRHGVRLNRDDPALMLLTINELILDQLVARLATQVEAAAGTITATVVHSRKATQDAASAMAEALVNQGAAYVAAQIKTAGDGLAAQIQTAVAADIRTLRTARRTTIRAAGVAIAAAALAFGLVIGVLVTQRPTTESAAVTTSPARPPTPDGTSDTPSPSAAPRRHRVHTPLPAQPPAQPAPDP